MNLTVFRSRMRTKMRQKRLSQKKLAAKLGKPVHAATIASWLREDGPVPSFVQFGEIATLLGVARRWLEGSSDDTTMAYYPAGDVRRLIRAYEALHMENKARMMEIITDLERGGRTD